MIATVLIFLICRLSLKIIRLCKSEEYSQKKKEYSIVKVFERTKT